MDADGGFPTCTTLAPGFHFWQRQTSRSTDERQTSLQQAPDSENLSPPVLVLLFTWLFCKPGSASKYVHLYTSRGWDVLQISSNLFHFLWPPSSRRFAEDVAKVLKSDFAWYNDVIVHAMSIGAYNYTTCLMLTDEKPEMKTYLFNKVRALVFDSLTVGSLDHMMNGIAMGLSQWGIIQSATISIARVYFLITHKTTERAFDTGVDFFKNSPLVVPTLVFTSKNDPMCDTNTLQKMVEEWRVKFPVTFQVWERSGHCAHLLHHSHQYQEVLAGFLASSLPQAKLQHGQSGAVGTVVSKL